MPGSTPYYLQYENRKGEFFERVWHLWNWKDIAGRYDAARKLNLGLSGSSQ
jgi:superoxide dismutase